LLRGGEAFHGLVPRRAAGLLELCGLRGVALRSLQPRVTAAPGCQCAAGRQCDAGRGGPRRRPPSRHTARGSGARAQVLDRRRQLELAEEQIVLEGALAGVTIPRRGDMSPDVVVRAVLAE
jgi:hypothetical protein